MSKHFEPDPIFEQTKNLSEKEHDEVMQRFNATHRNLKGSIFERLETLKTRRQRAVEKPKNYTPEQKLLEMWLFDNTISQMEDGADYELDKIMGLIKFRTNDTADDTKIESDRHRIIMLYQLGVLDYLRDTFPALNETKNMEKLIFHLLNPKTEIRTTVSKLFNDSKSDVLRERPLKKVNTFIETLGIEKENLK